MIGNGFDLRLGMKTKFSDMYEDYLSKEPPTDVIRRFKEALRLDAPRYETWGDFEIAMAQYASNFSSENELVSCVRDFKDHMGNHLRKEQFALIEYINSNSGALACAKEMERSMHAFHEGQTPNVINAIEALGDLHHAYFKFITFNYTNLLSQILQYRNGYYKDGDDNLPIHVHGRLDTDVVLGIDSVSQLGELPYNLTRRGERAFIKPSFNSMFDSARVKAAAKTLKESEVICIYGMSLGQSDKTWVNIIYEWLTENPNHHLVYFKYLDQQFSALRRDEMMDIEDDQRDELLKKLCDSEVLDGLENQVHIPIGYDIFNFRNAIEADAKNRKQYSTPGSMK